MLAGVPGDRIGQWARWGHIRASVSAAEPHVYAFADVAEALAVHLLLDIPGWLPANDESDNWEQGPRGLIAARLIEELSSRWQHEHAPGPAGQPGWRRLRQRFRTERSPP